MLGACNVADGMPQLFVCIVSSQISRILLCVSLEWPQSMLMCSGNTLTICGCLRGSALSSVPKFPGTYVRAYVPQQLVHLIALWIQSAGTPSTKTTIYWHFRSNLLALGNDRIALENMISRHYEQHLPCPENTVTFFRIN